jgi:hypothetical protein
MAFEGLSRGSQMGAIKLPHGEAIGGGDVLRTLAVSKIEGLGNVPHDENHRGGFFFKLLIGQLDLAENFFPVRQSR